MTRLDLRIIHATAILTKEWYASEERRNDFIEFARGVWEKSGRYNADEMVKKTLEAPESPFERIFNYWDEFNRQMVYSYIRWYCHSWDSRFADEDTPVGDRPVGSKFSRPTAPVFVEDFIGNSLTFRESLNLEGEYIAEWRGLTVAIVQKRSEDLYGTPGHYVLFEQGGGTPTPRLYKTLYDCWCHITKYCRGAFAKEFGFDKEYVFYMFD